MVNEHDKAPPATRTIDFGQELPRPSVGPYGKTDPLPKTLVARVHLEAGPHAPAVIAINKSVMIIGRGKGIADIDVGDESASRRHAYIVYRDGQFFLNDMGSTNGTFINGELVGSARLRDGAQFQIGTAIMRLEIS